MKQERMTAQEYRDMLNRQHQRWEISWPEYRFIMIAIALAALAIRIIWLVR